MKDMLLSNHPSFQTTFFLLKPFSSHFHVNMYHSSTTIPLSGTPLLDSEGGLTQKRGATIIIISIIIM